MKKLLLPLTCALSLCACKESDDSSASAPQTPRLTPNKPVAKMPATFESNVAFIIATECARCHIDEQKGGLSMATYTDLMKGGTNGPVIVPGKPDESRLVQLIEAEKMPTNGSPLTDEYKTDIRDWIAGGAKFDGPSEDAKLMDYVVMPEEEMVMEFGPGPGRGGSGRPTGPGGRSWNPFDRFDKNADGKLAKDEVQGRLKERFDEMDADQDGLITSEEFNARMEGRFPGGRRERPEGDQDGRPPRPQFDGDAKSAEKK